MNKILVANNKIFCDCESVLVASNKLTFTGNGEYSIEFQDCSCVELDIEILSSCYVKLFEYSSNSEVIMKRNYILDERSTLLVFKFYHHSKTKENVIVDLRGEYSKLDYHFSNLCRGDEEYVIDVRHNACHSSSEIINRSIASFGKIDFTINSYLPLGMIGCVLNQDTKIINLGDNYSTIRPNMYISEASVEAKHGSVIGRFGSDELFYLMSRGIPLVESQKLLVRSYIFSNLLVDLEGREMILRDIHSFWR